MSLDSAELHSTYGALHGKYGELCDWLVEEIRSTLGQRPFDYYVKGRPKDVAGFVLKALRKHREEVAERARAVLLAESGEDAAAIMAAPLRWDDPIGATSDKAGVRVIVSHLEAVESVAAAVKALAFLDVIDDDDKSKKLAPKELGYLGRHLQVRVNAHGRTGLVGLEVEVQLHTKAQNAWADVSHPLTYKPLPTGSDEVTRRVMRAVALVSLFDDEIAEARKALVTERQYRAGVMFDVLQKAAVPWRRREPDDELSLEVLQILEQVYSSEDLDQFGDLMVAFADEAAATMDAAQGSHPVGDLELLDQPEALAILHLLRTRKASLRAKWIANEVPLEWLEELGSAFGIAVTP